MVIGSGKQRPSVCPCCKSCKECEGFHKVMALKEVGLVLYRHATRKADDKAPTRKEDAFILHNTVGGEIKSNDFVPAFENRKFSCPRCQKIFEHAQVLLVNVPTIQNKVLGICDHCLIKERSIVPCHKCMKIVDKFTDRQYEQEKHKERILRKWITKAGNITTVESGHKIKGKVRRTRSTEMYVDKLCRSASLSSRQQRQPAVEQLLQLDSDRDRYVLQKEREQRKVSLISPSSSSTISSAHNNLDATELIKKKEMKKIYMPIKGRGSMSRGQNIFDEDMGLAKGQSIDSVFDVGELIEKSVRASRYYETQGTAKEESKKPDGYLSKEIDYDFFNDQLSKQFSIDKKGIKKDDYEKQIHFKRVSRDAYIAPKRENKTDLIRKADEQLQQYKQKDKKNNLKDSSRQYRSLENLLIKDKSKLEPAFSFVFPKEKEAKTLQPRSVVSSSELLKAVQDKIKEEFEKKNKENKKKQFENESEKSKNIKDNDKKLRGKNKEFQDKDLNMEDKDKKLRGKNKEFQDEDLNMEDKDKNLREKTNTPQDIDKKQTDIDKRGKKQQPDEAKGVKQTEKSKKQDNEKKQAENEEKIRKQKEEAKKKQSEKEEKLKKQKEEAQRKQLEKEEQVKKLKEDAQKKKSEKEEQVKKLKEDAQKNKSEKEDKLKKQKEDEQKQQLAKEEKLKKQKEDEQMMQLEKEDRSKKLKDDEQSKQSDKDKKKSEEKEKKPQTDKPSLPKSSKEKLGADQNKDKPTQESPANKANEEAKLKKEQEAAEKKAYELATANLKKGGKDESDKPKTERDKQQPKLPGPVATADNQRTEDLITNLIRMKKIETESQKKKPTTLDDLHVTHKMYRDHKKHHKKKPLCRICDDSELELDIQSILNQKMGTEDVPEIIVGENILKFKTSLLEDRDVEEVKPALFKTDYRAESPVTVENKAETNMADAKSRAAKQPSAKTKQAPEPEPPKGVIRYALSDRTFIEKGWTMLPTEKVVRKMNVYRMRPAHPEFDWFEHNKKKKMIEYDSGERFAEFDLNGAVPCQWFYKNGRLALNYYNAEELNAGQRFVVYSSGEPDERGRSQPITVLATFDFLGNGVVFDHGGKIRLKYNQTEGVVLDRSLGPVSNWKWHTLNDPPVLQQVMIDTQLAHKDPDIYKMSNPHDNKPRPDNEEMLAIEFDNFIKEKSKKLSQKFKPFQIRMKALKINEHFSLKVLDQATVYLIYRDGSTNIKLNIGMLLDHQEIVDTDTAEVGEVSNSLERFPAKTDSLAGLQKSVAYAQRFERNRLDRERRLRPPEPSVSIDQLKAGISKPLRPVFRTASGPVSACECKCISKRSTPSCSVYYNTRV